MPTATAHHLLYSAVRFPAAEALGAIGTGECVEYLRTYAAASHVMLRESCQVSAVPLALKGSSSTRVVALLCSVYRVCCVDVSGELVVSRV